MADTARSGDWPTDKEGQWEAFQGLRDAALAEADAALPPSGRLTPDRLTLVTARVALGPQYRRGTEGESIAVRPDVSDADWQTYLEMLARAQAEGQPSKVTRVLQKEIWFDDEAARFELEIIRNKRTIREDPDWQLWLRFGRTFQTEGGTRFVRQILNGTSTGSLGSINNRIGQFAQLCMAGFAADKFSGEWIQRPPTNWQNELRERFDPRVPLGELSLAAWQQLLSEPLDTTHILRNRGDATKVRHNPQYGWSSPEDIGTEEGEMTVKDVYDIVNFAIQDAEPIGSMPQGDAFTLTNCEIVMPDEKDGLRSVQISKPIGREFVVKVNSRAANLSEGRQAYNGLLGRMIRGEHRDHREDPRRWIAQAEKTVRGSNAKTMVVARVNRNVEDPARPEFIAEITYWRTVGDYAVQHQLRVQERTMRGKPHRTFENTRTILRRNAAQQGTYVRLVALPPELEALAQTHPDITATFTYDKWHELLKRPLDNNNLLT